MSVVGRYCRLLRPIRNHAGRWLSGDPLILREVCNLERVMYLVQFDDGSTTFLFAEENEILMVQDTSRSVFRRAASGVALALAALFVFQLCAAARALAAMQVVVGNPGLQHFD